jgi:hypothetical protein
MEYLYIFPEHHFALLYIGKQASTTISDFYNTVEVQSCSQKN